MRDQGHRGSRTGTINGEASSDSARRSFLAPLALLSPPAHLHLRLLELGYSSFEALRRRAKGAYRAPRPPLRGSFSIVAATEGQGCLRLRPMDARRPSMLAAAAEIRGRRLSRFKDAHR